jgi:uncharacterized protein
MKAINATTQQELSSDLILADTIISRMKGLLGRDSMPIGMALWIKPCNSVHTFCMKFAIDVVFLDKKQRVIALKKGLGPNRLTPIYFKAASVLELASGTLDHQSINPGDEIEIV